jgi:hypothetical protein
VFIALACIQSIRHTVGHCRRPVPLPAICAARALVIALVALPVRRLRWAVEMKVDVFCSLESSWMEVHKLVDVNARGGRAHCSRGLLLEGRTGRVVVVLAQPAKHRRLRLCAPPFRHRLNCFCFSFSLLWRVCARVLICFIAYVENVCASRGQTGGICQFGGCLYNS